MRAELRNQVFVRCAGRVSRPGLGAHWGRAWLQGLCPFLLGP